MRLFLKTWYHKTDLEIFIRLPHNDGIFATSGLLRKAKEVWAITYTVRKSEIAAFAGSPFTRSMFNLGKEQHIPASWETSKHMEDLESPVH